jgi:2-oxo-4-hydroxy-4-carboxy--5-ureidoimidazoline (OHCU) decarboxylase
MRHFLWFYSQVMNNEPELGDKLRQASAAPTTSDESRETGSAFLDQLSRADEIMLLHHLADARRRKPN